MCTETDAHEQPLVSTKTAKIERKALRALFGPSAEVGKSSPSAGQATERNVIAKDDTFAVRQWLTKHPSTKPIAGAVAKRTRFIGLHNSSSGGIWATLDREVYLKDSLHKDLETDDWAAAARSNSAKFPHAILEVRREGFQATSLIQTLDRSHLVRIHILVFCPYVLTFIGRTRAWLLA
jgi:hypothetical protein